MPTEDKQGKLLHSLCKALAQSLCISTHHLDSLGECVLNFILNTTQKGAQEKSKQGTTVNTGVR